MNPIRQVVMDAASALGKKVPYEAVDPRRRRDRQVLREYLGDLHGRSRRRSRPDARPVANEKMALGLGLRIRALRGGRTQAQFARAIGITRPYLSTFENGGADKPGSKIVLGLLRIFPTLNVTWLRDGVGPPFLSVRNEDEELIEVSAWAALSDEERGAISGKGGRS